MTFVENKLCNVSDQSSNTVSIEVYTLGDMGMVIYPRLLYVRDRLNMKIREINLFASTDLYKITICKQMTTQKLLVCLQNFEYNYYEPTICDGLSDFCDKHAPTCKL